MLSFSLAQVALTAAIIFGGFVVRGMSGFGAGLVAMPLLALVIPIHAAVPVMGLLVFVLFIFLAIRDRRDVIWREVRLLVVPTVAGVVGGLLLFRTLDNQLLLKCIGAITIAYAVYALAIHYVGLPPVKCSERWAAPFGFAGSFIDTMLGSGGGTMVVIYMHLRGVGKIAFRATVAVVWFVEIVARIVGYGMSGYYTGEVLILVLLLLPMMGLGTWCGERIHRRISQETFSKILALLLIGAGGTLLAR